MKRITILVVVLLLGGATLQAAVPLLAQTSGPGPRYVVEQGLVTGGTYQLASLHWQVSGTVRSENYSLNAAGPWGNCCCTFLPLVLRNK